LIATNFSPAAQNAAAYAADMAMAINARIALLHIYEIPLAYAEVPVTLAGDSTAEDIEIELAKLKNKLLLRTGGEVSITTEASIGDFFTKLETACDRIRPYAVVMGSQGTTAAERWFFGGHTVYAMKNLRWPLITVPPGASFSAVTNIGLACDFDKPIDTAIIDEIKILVQDFNANLYVLNSGKQEQFDGAIISESRLLEQKLAPVKPHYNFIINKNTDDGIMSFAKEHNIDLLIVLPRKHGPLDSLIHKSHTKQLVLHCDVPVMALHC